MAKLSDRQRKQIIAEYVEGDGRVSQRSPAKKYNVSLSTISKILKDDKAEQTKEKVTDYLTDPLLKKPKQMIQTLARKIVV